MSFPWHTTALSHRRSLLLSSLSQQGQQHQEDIIEKVSRRMKEAYTALGTDGILQLYQKQAFSNDDDDDDDDVLLQDMNVSDLLRAATMASCREGDTGLNKGRCASIVNALVAASHDDADRSVAWFDVLVSSLEKEDDFSSPPIEVDIVTLSCVISSVESALRNSGDNGKKYGEVSNSAMGALQKMSKKQSGNARRKELAAARRKKLDVNYKSILEGKYGIKVLFEDEDFLGVYKPAGMLCYAAKQKKRQRDVTLEDALSNVGIPLSTINPEARGIAHRLDRGASGCLIVAKNDYAHANLVSEFFRRKAQKSYITLVPNVFGETSLKAGTIDQSVDKKPALSVYNVLKTCNGGLSTLVEVSTKTGRKHQVRSHLHSIGAPIYFDPIYFNEDQFEIPGSLCNLATEQTRNHKKAHAYKFCLHCSSLNIPRFHLECKSEIPDWWAVEPDNFMGNSSFDSAHSPSKSGDDQREKYSNMTLIELKELCKNLKIKGYSNKRKVDLIDLIMVSK